MIEAGPHGTHGAVVHWCLPNIRVVLRRVEKGRLVSEDGAGVFVDGRKEVIQQAWAGSDGSIEWRDVPKVIEED